MACEEHHLMHYFTALQEVAAKARGLKSVATRDAVMETSNEFLGVSMSARNSSTSAATARRNGARSNREPAQTTTTGVTPRVG
jgi:hypothetical protein